MPTGSDVERRLVEICGPRFARYAGPADEVAGSPAVYVAMPGSVEAVSAVMRLAAERDLAVAPRGAGTKLDWGAPPARLDVLIDTGRLAGVWHRTPGSGPSGSGRGDWSGPGPGPGPSGSGRGGWSGPGSGSGSGSAAGAGSVEVGAGTPVRAVQAVLERDGFRLPLDPPSSGATIGGVVAADESGPLRQRYGTPCEQLVGVSYVDAEGRLRHSEGWEAGDLNRLLCGSQGALAVLVSATLRVQPLPLGRQWVLRSVWTPLEVHDLVRQVLAAAVDPAAIEVDLPAHRAALIPRQRSRQGPGTLAVLVEGDRTESVRVAEHLVTVLRGDARVVDEAPRWWHRYPFAPGEVALRLAVPISDLHAAIYALRDAVGGPVPVRGAAGVGVVHAALPSSLPADRVAAILEAVRGVLLFRGGTCVVTSAPAAVRREIDLWGQVPAIATLREVKERFDPHRRLAPGRYVGGL